MSGVSGRGEPKDTIERGLVSMEAGITGQPVIDVEEDGDEVLGESVLVKMGCSTEG